MHHMRWPLHPHPISEDSLLSWLGRVARCYDFTLDDLLIHDLGFHGRPDDLNIHAPRNLLKLLSERSGLSEENIQALTLSSWAPLLFDPFCSDENYFESYVHHYSLLLPLNIRKKFKPKQAWKPWITGETIMFLSACPICITDDPAGAIRLPWYLPLMLSCPIHQCLLRQCRIYQGEFIGWLIENEPVVSSPPIIKKMDQRTWSALTTSQVVLPRRTVHGGVWLRLLRTLLDELHIPASSARSSHAKDIASIWQSLNLEPRAGQLLWRPYETLSFEKQQQTLMAAAVAINRIETGFITPPGESVFLFLPELMSNENLTSYFKYTGNPSIIKPKSTWQRLCNSLDECIEKAKQDPDEAKSFRNVCLLGKDDIESVQRINNLLIEVGVPKEYLVP